MRDQMFKLVLLAVSGLVAAAHSHAHAASTLLICADRDGIDVRADLQFRKVQWMLQSQLQRRYRHWDVISSPFELIEKARNASGRSSIDILFLDKSCERQAALFAQTENLQRLDTVIVQDSEVDLGAWRSIGANRIASARAGAESGFVLRYLRALADGADPEQALRDAREVGERFSQAWQNASARPAVSPLESLASQWVGLLWESPKLDDLSFEPTWQSVSGPAWEQLKELFPSVQDGLPPSEVDQGGREADELWIDGEALSFLLQGMARWGGAKTEEFFANVLGVRLHRGNGELRVAVHLKRSMLVDFVPVGAKPKFGTLIGAYLPEVLRFRLALRDGVIQLQGLSEGKDTAFLKLALPAFGKVHLRRAVLDLQSGDFKAEAGVVANQIALIGKGNLEILAGLKVSLWESIQANAKVLEWPTVSFAAE